ncbi:MAG: hypothetical protein U1E53_20150 [Dongiaceae bacterium]
MPLAVVTMGQVDLPAATLRLVLRTAGQEDGRSPVAAIGEPISWPRRGPPAGGRWWSWSRGCRAASQPGRAGRPAHHGTAGQPMGLGYGWLLDWRPLLSGLEVHGHGCPAGSVRRRSRPPRPEGGARGSSAPPCCKILRGTGLLLLWLAIRLPTPGALLLVGVDLPALVAAEHGPPLCRARGAGSRDGGAATHAILAGDRRRRAGRPSPTASSPAPPASSRSAR